jgi:tRNA pseudouridine13 synthase
LDVERIKPPASEARLGLEEYASSGPGIGGLIKDDPRDFVVREVLEDGMVLDLDSDSPGDQVPGDFTHFTMVKENWETNRAIKEIASRLGVSRERLAYAGTKDKRALTAQRVSAFKVPIERLRSLKIKDIRLKDFSYADENLGLGSLRGNRFSLKVRDVCPDACKRIALIASQIEAGFPNYYGIQRFGDVRPFTHEAGRLMLKGDFEGAVMTYLSASFDGEDQRVRALRDELSASRDFKAALLAFPDGMGYEKSMLNRLIQSPGDWTGAIRELPKTLQKMFVHAYQGHVFNRALSECMRRGLQVESLPLVGLDVAADAISARIMEADGVERGDFRLSGMGELSSRGEYRQAYAVAEALSWSVDGDSASFEFTLGRGSYATVLMREFMKNA